MKYRIMYLLVFMYSYNIIAQDCSITFSGKVEDFHEKTSLQDAVIHIKELNKYTTTDSKGYFKFNNLCQGSFTVEISHISCDAEVVKIALTKNLNKTFVLEHHVEDLEEVKITGNRKIENTSIEKSVSKKEIDVFSDKSLGDVLNNVSGVSSLNTGNTIVKPMIHGLHSSRLIIMNNNVRQSDQEWGAEHAPNIDINSSDRIDVVKGANTLIYGSDAIGGLILIRPKNYAAKDSLFGSSLVSFNTNGWGGNVNSELIKTYKSGFYTKGQVSYKVFGDVTSPDYNLSNTGIKNLNASVRFGYKSFKKGFDVYYSFVDNTIGILRAAHVGNVNDLVRAINSEQPSFIDDFSYRIDHPKQSVTHHLGKVEVYKRFRGLGKLTAQYDFQINNRKEFDRRRAGFRDLPAADFRLFTTSFQPNLKIDAFEYLKINTGFLLRYQQNDAAGESVTKISIPLIPDYKKFEVGAYAIANYNLSSSTEISAGIRYDYAKIKAEKKYKIFDWEENNYDVLFPEFSSNNIEDFEILTFPKFNFHNISASLGLAKSFDNDLELLFNYGLASRMPNVSELFSDGLHHSAARIETGNLTLNKEVANKLVLSLEHRNQNFGFSINPYYKYINDFIQLIPSGEASTTIRGAFIEWKYNQVDAQIFGVDIDVNKKISDKFSYNGNVSLLQGDNLTEDIPLIHMPSTNFSNTITYTNQKWNQLSVGITQHTQLKQNRFPDYNFYTFNPINQQDVYVDISTPPNAYTLFDFNSSVNLKMSPRSNLNIAFNIENIFNTSYRDYLNRLRYFADDTGRNFKIKLKLNY